MSKKLRGLAAARRIQQKAEERRSNSRGGSVWRFMLDSGDQAVVRFRGLMLEPPEAHIDFSEYDMEDLVEAAKDLQCYFREDMTEDELREAVTERAKSLEPVPLVKHYIARNKGKRSVGLDAMPNCGDMTSALEGSIREHTECRFCAARLSGDEGVGWPNTQFCFSVYDTRYQHQIVQADGSKDYAPCTMEEDGYCKHCAFNDKLGDYEDLSEKEKKKYRKRYQMGLRVAEFSSTVAGQIDQCAQRVSKICRSCGTGKIKINTTFCPECEEEISLADLVESGWDPLDPVPVECPHCAAEVMPEQDLECSECDEPERARLCDVPILVAVSGKGKQKAWSFTEQLPVRPLDPEVEADAKILATPLPDWDEHCKEPTIAEQVKQLGYSDDPVDDDSEDEPAPVKRPPKTKKSGTIKKRKGSPFGKKRL